MTPVTMHKPHLSQELAATKAGPPDTLEEIAAEINREHGLAEASIANAVAHAITAGQLLYQVKDKLPHGQWLPWLADHFAGSERTARNYMTASSKSATVADLTDVHATARSLYAPEPKAKPDTSTAVGRLTAAVQGTPPPVKTSSTKTPKAPPATQHPEPAPEPDYIDATVIEDDPEPEPAAAPAPAPEVIPEPEAQTASPSSEIPAPLAKQLTAALDDARDLQDLIAETEGPISLQSAASAMNDAAVKCRKLTVDLSELAIALRKAAA